MIIAEIIISGDALYLTPTGNVIKLSIFKTSPQPLSKGEGTGMGEFL